MAERPLAEVSSEYPRLPDALGGRPHRFVYSSGFWFEATPHHGEIHKHEGDRITTRRLDPGHTCGEPVFVARRAGRAEDDGYLLTFAHDRASGTSYLLILDATDLSTRAEVHLPLRVPAGFHGTWLAAPA